jgi:hypothetical protein
VTFGSARLTLKQHRFEVGAGALAAVLLGAAALWVTANLADLDVPGRCPSVWPGSIDQVTADCAAAIGMFMHTREQGTLVLFAMAALPWAAGLVGGVGLVGRELEARTAQTAWALAASRRRWFARQLWPVLVVIGVTVAFASVAASLLLLEATRPAGYRSVFELFGFHGPVVVARAFVALGLGLIVGAALGRTLPALIVGALLAVGCLTIAGSAREAWVQAQPRVLLDPAAAADPRFNGIVFERAWRAPDGTVLPELEAMGQVPADGRDDPWSWLPENGYEILHFGLTSDTLRRWEPMEIAGSLLVGLVFVLGTVVIVDRRRPT